MATRRLLVEVVADNEQLVRTFRSSSRETAAFGRNAKSADRELSRVTRGALAGSGVFRGLGRSIAFASGGFLAFASVGQLLRSSVDAAREAAVTQRQLQAQLKVTGQSWVAYRGQIEQTLQSQSQLSGFTADSLEASLTTITRGTGDVTKALKLNALAADIARGRNISLMTASVAVGKAAAGSTTALRRLGIELPKGATGAQGLALAAQKFAGQAQAGATAADRFNAILHNSEVIIGSALLPTLNKYLGRLGDWLAKMDESGRLQKDVNNVLGETGHVFHVVEGVVRGVDKVTGGFVNTLKILAAFKLASLVTSWIASLEGLAAAWTGVATQATAAAGAEGRAVGFSGGGFGGRAGGGGLLGSLRRPGVAARVGEYTGAVAAGEAAGAGGFIGAPVLIFGGMSDQLQAARERFIRKRDGSTWVEVTWNGKTTLHQVLPSMGPVIPGSPVILPSLRTFPTTGNAIPLPFQTPGFQPPAPDRPRLQTGPFGNAKPLSQYFKQFQLNFAETLAQAQAALTRGTADDVAAAREVVARIKRLIDQGRLHGQALVQALGLEASALSTIWAAEDAAAQKRAAAALKAKERIQAQIQDSIDPLRIEVQLSRAQALGQPLLPYLKRLRAAARDALASGKLSLEQQKEAYDQIASLNQQIKDAQTTATATFAAPARLQLALAKDAALGRDQTKDLMRLKTAILKFIRTHRHNIAALIDAYGQLEQVNQQLGTQTTNAYGDYRKASLRALTAGLTGDQRRMIEQRLSQVGPGGTIPETGTGAAGYIIDPATGQPVRVDGRRHPRSQMGRVGGLPSPFNPTIDLNVYIDGKQVEATVTNRQHRRRRHMPTQTRGPHAATSSA